MTGFPERADPAAAARVSDAVVALRDRVGTFAPDAIVAISNDHFTATSIASIAPFGIATGSRFRNPATPKIAEFLRVPERVTPGDGRLARFLLEAFAQQGVDAAQLGGRFGFDENFSVPLHLLGLADTPTVPLVVNTLEPPMPTLERCRHVGELLGRILRAQRLCERVLVLGTGGLSHSVGVASAGEIDEQFDRRFLDRLVAGDLESVARLDPAVVAAAGNGTAEIRQWIVACSAVAPQPVEVLAYEPIPEWLTGIAVAGSATAESPNAVPAV